MANIEYPKVDSIAGNSTVGFTYRNTVPSLRKRIESISTYTDCDATVADRYVLIQILSPKDDDELWRTYSQAMPANDLQWNNWYRLYGYVREVVANNYPLGDLYLDYGESLKITLVNGVAGDYYDVAMKVTNVTNVTKQR